MAAGYVELHAHSAYSFLDGACLPEELVETACSHGYDTFALTDHNSLSGAMEFAKSAQAAGLRALHGAELDLDDGHHLTLLVGEARGWSNLCRLITIAHAHTRDVRSAARPSDPSVSLATLLEHAEGLICLSGCATHGVNDQQTLERLREAFGTENLRVELQRPYARGDRPRNRALERLAERLGLATIATGNVHAHTKPRALLQDAFVAIRHGATLDGCETLRRPNHSHVMAGPGAMAERFSGYPRAVAETVELAERIQFDLTEDLGYRYPGCEDPDAPRRLSEICQAAFAQRYPRGSRHHEQAAARLAEELRVIEKLGLAGFFLLHNEMLELARAVAIEVRGADTARALLAPGRGRGSSVSSIVCYLTGLSHIDPIVNELLLGRFLHEDLDALPDIDIDFPRDIREKLIPRVHEHYGSEKAALVAAFSTYRCRGAIRELGKALGLPAGEVERVARGSEGHGSAGTVAADIQAALGRDRLSGRWAWLATLADEAYGLPRHISQHPGGMVISTEPLLDRCPVVPSAMEGRQMVQWDKDSCADARFLKIDLLGLGMLSAVERAVDLIARTCHERVDLSRIPFDDEDTFKAIREADTVGVFQIESRAQMSSLRRTKPQTLEDLTVQVAIVRPGPIVGGAVNPYLQRRQRLRSNPDFQIPYEHPSLEGPLRCTLGTIIFQDQVIEVARVFAGFSSGQAESLRRAMSRKRSETAIESHRLQFIEGAMHTHPDIDEACALRVFGMIRGFSGFGFPKAHGAAFGLLAYQSTWLRVHFPQQFLCALLNEQPMGFYPPDALIHEAGRRGVEVLAPDVNDSEIECTISGSGKVRIGLGYIKNIPRADLQRLIAARTQNGRFERLEEFISRCGIARASIETLAWAGALGDLYERESDRRATLWQAGVATPGRSVKDGTQLALELELPDAPALHPLSDWEQMIANYSTSGTTVGRHPLSLLRERLSGQGVLSTAELAQIHHGKQITVAGLVVARQKPQTAKGITFMLLEDEHGTINVIVPPTVYQSHRMAVRAEPLILVHGRLEWHPSGAAAANVLADSVMRLDNAKRQANVEELAPKRSTTIEPADDFIAVAPPAMSFGQGRRR
ncbi:MAG: DNA polymerase III subunit alpha [Solirubrobacteraceae bacterium]